MDRWLDEVHPSGSRFGLRVRQVLYEGRSAFQDITVVETEALGRALMLDGLWMAAEGDERVYHEMLVHPALTTARAIERVLVVGGGDGGTVREVLRHPEVRVVDMVEIDRQVVDVCREHLPSIGTAWEDPRLRIHFADGLEWVRRAPADAYDVVLVDGSDPVGPAKGLYDAAFHADCARILRPGGVLATQGESPRLQRDVHVALVRTLRAHFRRVHPYYAAVSIYPGGAWSWVWASQDRLPLEPDEARARLVEESSWYYHREIHRAAFAVPLHLRRILGP